MWLNCFIEKTEHFFFLFFITGIQKLSGNIVNQTENDNGSTEKIPTVLHGETQNTDPKEGTYTLAKMILFCPYTSNICEIIRVFQNAFHFWKFIFISITLCIDVDMCTFGSSTALYAIARTGMVWTCALTRSMMSQKKCSLKNKRIVTIIHWTIKCIQIICYMELYL